MNPNDYRITKNIALLYGRMLFIMLVTLYMTRITLRVLGASDYGIYNVVGGVVSFLSMFTGSMTSAITRFLTVALGERKDERMKIIFSSAVNIQAVLSVVVLLIAESAGLWFLNDEMNIPSERMSAANWVFHCSVLTFAVNLIVVPYNAVIIAHERMKAFAYISSLDVILKLGVVCFLSLRLYDGLVVYALLLFMEAMVILMVYRFYCKRNFDECRYHFIHDRGLLKKMAAFAGWNFVGVTSGVLRDHGSNILLNLFFGPLVNAARAISVQVGTAVNAFVTNFMTALNPQLMKSYAVGDSDYMMSLIYRGTRFSYYLALFFALPLLLGTDTVLGIWLGHFPEHTISLVRLMLLFVLSESISQPLVTAMFATGKIRNYQMVVGGAQMAIFPLSFLALRLGAAPESILYITIAVSQICLFLRLFMLRRMIGLRIPDYIRCVYQNILSVSLATVIPPLVTSRFLPDSILGFMLLTALCVASEALVIYVVGFSAEERRTVRRKTGEFICKVMRK